MQKFGAHNTPLSYIYIYNIEGAAAGCPRRGFYVPSEPRAIFLPSNSSALLTWFCPGSLHWTWHVLCRLGLPATPYFVVPTTLNYRVLALVDLIYVLGIFEVDLSLASPWTISFSLHLHAHQLCLFPGDLLCHQGLRPQGEEDRDVREPPPDFGGTFTDVAGRDSRLCKLPRSTGS